MSAESLRQPDSRGRLSLSERRGIDAGHDDVVSSLGGCRARAASTECALDGRELHLSLVRAILLQLLGKDPGLCRDTGDVKRLHTLADFDVPIACGRVGKEEEREGGGSSQPGEGDTQTRRRQWNVSLTMVPSL